MIGVGFVYLVWILFI